jgi:hypothetical protein
MPRRGFEHPVRAAPGAPIFHGEISIATSNFPARVDDPKIARGAK